MSRHRDLDAVPVVADGQAGVFSRDQAHDEGWSPHQICRRLRTGHWIRVAGRALARADVPVTPAGLVWAVRLTWPDAVASHRTAALFHRFPLDAGALDLGTVDAVVTRPLKSLRDVREHLVALGPRDVRRLPGGALVTTPRRTALDCLDRAAGALRPPPAHARAGARDGLGRWGTPQLVRLLRVTAGEAYSPAERIMHDVLHRARLTGWTANATVTDRLGVLAVVDILFAAAKVVVEVDGWIAHADRAAFQNAARR